MTIKPTHFFLLGLILLSNLAFSIITTTNTLKDILFIAYDQGESNAFIPIMKALEKQNISYQIIAFGQALKTFQNNPHLHHLPLKRQNTLKKNRTLALTPSELTQLTHQLNVSVIYSGMASTGQAQLMHMLSQNNTRRCIAFYDNFAPPHNEAYIQPFITNITKIDEIHVPGKTALLSMLQHYTTKCQNIVITGNPDLAEWSQALTTVNPKPILADLKLSPKWPIMLFAGGAEPQDYFYFKQWANAALKLPKIQFIVSLHPKNNGILEQNYIKKIKADHITLVPKNSWSTTELCQLAQTIITHKSSVGLKAAYAGKSLIYIAEPSYSNILIEQKISQHCIDTLSVLTAMKTNLKTTNNHTIAYKLKLIEAFPEHPLKLIVSRIQNQLYQSHQEMKKSASKTKKNIPI